MDFKFIVLLSLAAILTHKCGSQPVTPDPFAAWNPRAQQLSELELSPAHIVQNRRYLITGQEYINKPKLSRQQLRGSNPDPFRGGAAELNNLFDDSLLKPRLETIKPPPVVTRAPVTIPPPPPTRPDPNAELVTPPCLPGRNCNPFDELEAVTTTTRAPPIFGTTDAFGSEIATLEPTVAPKSFLQWREVALPDEEVVDVDDGGSGGAGGGDNPFHNLARITDYV